MERKKRNKRYRENHQNVNLQVVHHFHDNFVQLVPFLLMVLVHDGKVAGLSNGLFEEVTDGC